MNSRHLVLSRLPMLVALVLGGAEKPVKHTVKKVPAETSEELRQTKAEFEWMLKDKLEKLEEEIRELIMKPRSSRTRPRLNGTRKSPS